MGSSKVIECREVPIDRVTVFPDRAEIKRTVKVDVEPGTTEVQIRYIPGSVVDESVRVSGKGTATLHEVKIANKRIATRDKSCPEDLLRLSEELEKQRKMTRTLEARRDGVQKKKESLDALIMRIGGDEMNEEKLEGIPKLFQFYENQMVVLSEKHIILEEEVRVAKEELGLLQSEHYNYFSTRSIKIITVVLECTNSEQVELALSYQVEKAHWTPIYDIRADRDNEELQISYYGNITQHTGEDWNGCELVLSTASPSTGGTVPELGTLDVQIKPQSEERNYSTYTEVRKCAATEERRRAPNQDINYSFAAVSDNALSTEFIIERPASIPPNGTETKVNIGLATLSPVFSHECVPSKDKSVFFTASAVNTSPLPFLAGEAAVFLDGNFISKSSLKAVSPNERFPVSLGVDASVRVEYKPALKRKGESGMITKTASTVHEQKIVVKNTKKEDILITVKENVPRSTDEKIKVSLVNPTATVTNHVVGEPIREGALINNSNNLEWTVHVPANEHKEMNVKWNVEYPNDVQIEYEEKY